MKKFFVFLVVCVCFSVASFAQSNNNTKTYEFPLGFRATWPKHSDWAFVDVCRDGSWLVEYENFMVQLSADGSSYKIVKERPQTLADVDVTVEKVEKYWDENWIEKSPTNKKFKYFFKTDDKQTTLVITVKA